MKGDEKVESMNEPVVSASGEVADLRITIVGMFAVVMRENELGDPVGARLLFPNADSERQSTSGARAAIPAHVPVLGLAIAQHAEPPENTLFRCEFQFPGMDIYPEVAPFLDMAFYDTRGLGVAVVTKALTEFYPVDKPIDKEAGPKPENARSLRWLADMQQYALEEEVHTIADKYLGEPGPGELWSYCDVDFGRMEVARIETASPHRYRWLHLSKPELYHQALANAIRVVTKVAGDVKFRFGGRLVTMRAGKDPIDVLMGSVTVDGIAHPAIAGRENCGVPAFHGELLYDFSRVPPRRGFAPVAVCTELHDDDKDPVVGRCVPGSKMTAPRGGGVQGKKDVFRAAALVRGSSRALGTNLTAVSLHIGVDRYSSQFLDVKRVVPVGLNSCANDANATAALALRRGFKPTTLLDYNATAGNIDKALNDADSALMAAGGLFILSFSCYGCPQVVRKGWCVNDKILPFDGIMGRLRKFNPASKILLISDSCFAGVAFVEWSGVKQLSVRYAQELLEMDSEVVVGELGLGFSGAGDSVDGLDEAADDNAPTVYHFAACAANELTPDGTDKTTSPFTSCLLTAISSANGSSFDSVIASVLKCSAPRHPELERRPNDDSEFDLLGPFHVV